MTSFTHYKQFLFFTQVKCYRSQASKILQSYRGITIMNHHVDLTNPEDVFMIVSVNNYLPDEKKYKSCWGWSENYES